MAPFFKAEDEVDSNMTDDERYVAAVHAMQTGVAYMMQYDSRENDPKHLRVGINCAMVEFSALVKLLVAKGVLTLPEFKKALADAMEEERDRYQALLKEHLLSDVQLG